jgi:hypothetical protein
MSVSFFIEKRVRRRKTYLGAISKKDCVQRVVHLSKKKTNREKNAVSES